LEQAFVEELFAAQDTQNVQFSGAFVVAIENPAGRLHKLAIAGVWAHLRDNRSQLGVLSQQLRMRQNAVH
jgi:hypothetical protein